ncbi:hypothetical protein BXZ70DRAFT_1011421 [Cristinia sonorae]|uniref:DUF6534 domain-containing protein n=1 Tax=Cristinia sonorae TaxID=1940300 RepID=A0A8K0UH40_9AGAR|nr:hypothetical protein BXZ70DRAFT_1011421 [Cristinia sonorae]
MAPPAGFPTPAAFLGGCMILTYATFPLYGIFIAQVYEYAFKFVGTRRDTWYLRANVTLLTILETLHTVISIHFIYFYTIKAFADPEKLLGISWSAPLMSASETVMVILVHSFYIHRIYIMSDRNKWLAGALIVVLIVRSAFSCISAVFLAVFDTWITFHENPRVKFVLTTSLGLLAFADFTVASMMILYIYRRRTGHKKSDHIVRTLIVYFVNSGFITVIFSSAIIISFVTQATKLSFAGPMIMTTKLYANAFLGSLNMRSYLRDSNPTTAITLSTFQAGVPSSAGNQKGSFATSMGTATSQTRTHVSEDARFDGSTMQSYPLRKYFPS